MFRRNKILSVKRLLLIPVLLLVVLAISGCLGAGTRPLGWSGVAVSGGDLFFGSMDGKLIALDSSSGNPRWQVSLEGSAEGGIGCAGPAAGVGIYGTPLVAGDLVFVSAYNGRLYAINTDSGALRWVYPHEGNLEPLAGGPALAGDRVYFGSFDGKVYALNVATGEKEWQFETGDEIWATPVVDGDRLYIGSFDNKLYALDTEDGSQVWTFKADGAFVSMPLVYNGTVYVGSLDRHFYALDAADGSLLWSFPANDEEQSRPGSWFWASAVAYNNAIYAPCLDGWVYVLDAESGLKITEFDLGSPVAASPVLAGSYIVVAAEDGRLHVIDGDSNEIRPLTDLALKVVAPLVASEGIVYVHTQEDETVYALDPEARLVVWSYTLQ